MTFTIIEEKLYKCFLNSEQNNINNSEKTQLAIANIENEILRNKNLLKPILLELLSNSDEIMNIAERITNKLFTCYKSRGYKIRSEEASTLMLSRIIMSLCYGLAILEKQKLLSEKDYYSFIKDMLKFDINKMYYYLRDEALLSVFFEDYV